MARKKAEIDLLGVASKEELLRFEVGKQHDKELAETVSQVNNDVLKSTSTNKSVLTEEELLRIKKKGEQEILDIQNELKEFQLEEERKISFLPIEEEEEEEEEYEPTKLEIIKDKLSAPFIAIVDKYDTLTLYQKLQYLKSIIIVFTVFITMTLAVYAAKKYNVVTSDYIRVKLEPEGGGLFATPSVTFNFNNDQFILTKLRIDGQNTVFYIDGVTKFTDEYSARMVDSDMNEYYMDQHFMRNIKLSNEGKVIALEPLVDGIKSFNLIISDNNSGEEYTYHFKLNKFLKKTDYVKMYNVDNVSNEGLNIDNYVASATGAFLNYSLSSEGLNYKYKVIDRPGMGSDLYEDLSVIPSKQNRTEVFEFPDQEMTILQESFNAPKSFDGQIIFKADNIFKSFETNKTITRTQAQSGLELKFDEYTLFIEGLQKRGDMAVLVYHVIDNNFVEEVKPVETEEDLAKKKKESNVKKAEPVAVKENFTVESENTHTSKRVYSYLDVQIITYDSKGNVTNAISPSKINVSDEGGDIVFVDSRLSKVAGNFAIKVNSVNIRDAKFSANINLDEYGNGNRNVKDYEMHLSHIETGFNSRLAYKATDGSRADIVNFSDEVLNNKELMVHFIPMNLKDTATYYAEVIASTARGNEIYAVVEEDFKATAETGFVHVNVDHRVVYNINTGLIVSDEIIRVNKIQ